MRLAPIRFLPAALFSIFALAGCPGTSGIGVTDAGIDAGTDAGVDAGTIPTINSFTATPNSLPSGGGLVTLAWDVTGATTLSVDQGVGAVAPSTVGNKVVLVGASATFTLTATNEAGSSTVDAPVTVAAPPPTQTVSGTVVDDDGQPAPGRTVLIAAVNFDQTVVTDANGAFSVADVPTPYDATIVEASQAIQYKGLTRPDPSLTAFFLVRNRSAVLTGHFDGGVFPETSNYKTDFIFASPEVTDSLADPPTGDYSSTISWSGPATTTGTLYALQIRNDGGLPSDYPGYGVLSGVVLEDMQTLPGQNVSLSPVTAGTLSGTVFYPTNYSLFSKSLALQAAPFVTLFFVSDFSSDAIFSYTTPAISNTTLVVEAAATSDAGEFSATVKTAQSANASGVELEIASAPLLTQPANMATGVTAGVTAFSWTIFAGGVYELSASSASGPSVTVITAATTAVLPDLSDAGFLLPTSTVYTWSIVGLAPVQNVDLLAAPGGLNRATIDISEGVSASQNFTTAP